MADITAGQLKPGFYHQAMPDWVPNGANGQARLVNTSSPGVKEVAYVGRNIGGLFKLTGTVTTNNVPVNGAIVEVFGSVSHPVLPLQWIDSRVTLADGVFLFDGIMAGHYDVMAVDRTSTYNNVVKANVAAVAR